MKIRLRGHKLRFRTLSLPKCSRLAGLHKTENQSIISGNERGSVKDHRFLRVSDLINSQSHFKNRRCVAREARLFKTLSLKILKFKTLYSRVCLYKFHISRTFVLSLYQVCRTSHFRPSFGKIVLLDRFEEQL